MDFNPLKIKFVLAVLALIKMTKSTWEKWGWTEEEILVVFKKNPWCMMASENKITGVMDILVNMVGRLRWLQDCQNLFQ